MPEIASKTDQPPKAALVLWQPATVITRFVAGIYLGAYFMNYCEFSLAELLPWTDTAKTVILCLGCATVLFVGELFDIGSLIRAVLFGVILSKSGISDAGVTKN